MSKIIQSIKCLVCAKEFLPTRKGMLCCSKSCSRKNYYQKSRLRIKDVACVVCGEIFSPTRKDKKYCSVKCKNARRNKRKLKLKCYICKSIFESSQTRAKFCSNECKTVAKKEYKNSRRKFKDIIHKSCAQCGKDFILKLPNQVYCSSLCREIKKQIKVCKCLFCGKDFVKKGNAQKYCSNICKIGGKFYRNNSKSLKEINV